MEFKKEKTAFLKYLEHNLSRSQKTLETYDLYLTRFFNWLAKNKISSLTKINKQTIQKYKAWLRTITFGNNKKFSAKTFNYHLIALRMLFVYLRRSDKKVFAPEQIELINQPKARPIFLTNKELANLLEVSINKTANSINKQPIQLRDKALLEFLFATGLKISEIIKLKKADLKHFKLGQQANFWLNKYLEKRTDKSPFLFISYDRASSSRTKAQPTAAALTPRSLQRIVHKCSMLAGLMKKVTPQIIRNTFGLRLLKNGATIKEVRAAMNFESDLAARSYIEALKKSLKSIIL
ncbi:tyrosine-type recombinase/integrase [Candidatus Falkowbacteria bacterium]|nr:tyrosine-type recombinase/integrase [Candidatus Falkowbacteria bacterium]